MSPGILERWSACVSLALLYAGSMGPSRSYYEKDRTTETIKSKTKHFSLDAAEGTPQFLLFILLPILCKTLHYTLLDAAASLLPLT